MCFLWRPYGHRYGPGSGGADEISSGHCDGKIFAGRISGSHPLVPSNPMFYGPYTDKAIVLESTDHYEVGKSMKKIIKEGKYQGISVISAAQVIEAAEELLQRYPQQAAVL